MLLTLVWLRLYPTGVVLGYFFGIAESSVRRMLARFLPVLGAAGRATFRWPKRKQGRSLPEILEDCPEVAHRRLTTVATVIVQGEVRLPPNYGETLVAKVAHGV